MKGWIHMEHHIKQSEVNRLIQETLGRWQKLKVSVPPWAAYSPMDWRRQIEEGKEGLDISEMVKWGQGLDISNFPALGVKPDFSQCGLVLITVENTSEYCHKLMFQRQNQETPWHKHVNKNETIGVGASRWGKLGISLYNSNEIDGCPDYMKSVRVKVNGCWRTVKADNPVQLQPGEFITLPAGVWHRFFALYDDVSLWEVSAHNDDFDDNKFLVPRERFMKIEPDVLPAFVLCNDLHKLLPV